MTSEDIGDALAPVSPRQDLREQAHLGAIARLYLTHRELEARGFDYVDVKIHRRLGVALVMDVRSMPLTVRIASADKVGTLRSPS